MWWKFREMSKLSLLISIGCFGLFLALVVLIVTLVLVRGSGCDALNECDAFKPICAAYRSDHQFFYSQCDMERENCMTGSNWKRDHFSHCNVYI